MLIAMLFALGIAIFIGGQHAYRIHTERRRVRWEKNIERNAQGIRVDCLDYTLEADSDSAILLVHGFADSPVVFRNLAHWFTDHGITARAMRLPGFGVTLQQQAVITQQDWMDAVEREVASLSNQYANVWIAAHSLGCAITLHWLAETHQNIRGIFLLAPLVRVSDKRSILLPPHTWFRFGKRCFRYIHTLENLLPCDIRYPLPRNQLPTDRFVHFAIYDALFSLVESFETAPITLPVPTTVFLARYDRIVDNTAAHELFDRLPSENLRILTMENSGHVLPLDNEWQDIAQQITDTIHPL